MNIKRKLTELRQWQEEAYRYRYDASVRHQCQCCGEVFAGNFCPACGPIVSGFTLFLSSVAILFCIITIWLREWEFLIHYAGSILTLYGGLTAVTLAAGYYFNRLSLRRQNQA